MKVRLVRCSAFSARRRRRSRRSRRLRISCPPSRTASARSTSSTARRQRRTSRRSRRRAWASATASTEWWFTEFYVKGEREGLAIAFDAIEWENKFQLTETGKYPVDIGFIAEFELPHDRSEGNEFRFGPLFQTEFDRVQLNFNPLLTNITRAVEGNGTYFGYQWQVRYRWQQTLEFGAQGFGDMGRWDHVAPMSEQSHRWDLRYSESTISVDGRRSSGTPRCCSE